MIRISSGLWQAGHRPVLVTWEAEIADPNGTSSSYVESQTLRVVEELCGGRAPADDAVERYKEVLKILGRNPNRYRISSDALLRRVRKDRELPRISQFVDICNLISLETGWPVGCYDLNRISGDLALRLGRSGEKMETLGKGNLDIENLPILADQDMPFGSPISDSLRADIRQETKKVLYVIYAYNPLMRDELYTLIRNCCLMAGLGISSLQAVEEENE